MSKNACKARSGSKLARVSKVLLCVIPISLIGSAGACAGGQAAALPDAPVPQTAPSVSHTAPPAQPKPVIDFTSNGTPCEEQHPGMPAMTGAPPNAGQSNPYELHTCPHHKIPQTSEHFTVGPQPEVRTVKDKARMTERDLRDPYDVASIAGDSGITVASDSHSRYGPGMRGFGHDFGVGLGQDATSEVTNTFVIPTVTHQDPQYHREPDRSKMKRIEHAVADTAWTQSDKGKGMPNYSNLVGDAADSEVGDFYVPGVKRGLGATAERYGVGLGMTPVDNLITEFSPDLASHVHVKSVFWQSIIDNVAGVTRTAGSVAAARKHAGTPATKPAGRHH